MTSATGLITTDKLVAYVADELPYRLCLCCGTAVLIYDGLLCFDREIDCIWKRSFGLLSVLYVLNRYIEVITAVLRLALLVPVSDKACTALAVSQSVTVILPYVAWKVFSTFRMYALSGRSCVLTMIVGVLTCTYVIPDLYQVIHIFDYKNHPYPYNCQGPYPRRSRDVTISLVLSCRVLSLIGESLVLIWTIKETYPTWRSVLTPWHPSHSISRSIFENGIACFSIPVILNISLLTSFVFKSYESTTWQAISALRDPITSILVSRFILDLRMLGNKNIHVSAPREQLTTDISLHPSNFTADIPSFVNPNWTGETTVRECRHDSEA